MSRRHPTFEQLETKRRNIQADLKRLRPVPTFEEVLKARKHRHGFNPCAKPDCALRTHTVDQITDLLIAKELDLSKPPEAPQG